jgi:4-hydroxybenzoate polyprenyltransferase
MSLLAHFMTLLRVRNLAFIGLTQFLFYFCIVRPQLANYPDAATSLGYPELTLLALASILIAAGGYVINDYFDQDIDRVNRPHKAVLGKHIGRRWGIFWHMFLSLAGISLSLLLTFRTGNWLVFLFNCLAVLLLWIYSTSLKRQVLIGNIVISMLTAWVVLVMYVCEAGLNLTRLDDAQRGYIMSVYKVSILYGGFAFMSSVIREAVKDMEDISGDARYGCRTMPIVWGVRVSKVFVSVWMIVLFFALFALAVYSVMLEWWMFAIFIAAAVMWPLGWSFNLLLKASYTPDYTRLSRLMKWVMFNGIVSMLFFMIYE